MTSDKRLMKAIAQEQYEYWRDRMSRTAINFERRDFIQACWASGKRLVKAIEWLGVAVIVLSFLGFILWLGERNAPSKCIDEGVARGVNTQHFTSLGCFVSTSTGQMIPLEEAVPVERGNKIVYVPVSVVRKVKE
jgi:hypothetical protein